MPIATLAACAALALASPCHASQLEEIVKSKPAMIDGFEFVAATESVWTVPTTFGKTSIEIQLYITNRVGRDRVFPIFDTFALHIMDAAGHEIPFGGGRDHTLPCRPVLIRSGDTYCLCRDAAISWNKADNWKTRSFTFEDGTGSWFDWKGVPAGSYTLNFSIACDGLDSQTKFLSQMEHFDWSHYLIWTGHGATHDVAFHIVDPPSE